MYKFHIVYGSLRRSSFITADNRAEAIKKFRRRHPRAKIYSIKPYRAFLTSEHGRKVTLKW